MKILKTITFSILTLLLITSCSTKDDLEFHVIQDNHGYYLVREFDKEDHTIELYAKKDTLIEGYNPLAIRILDKATNTYVPNIDLKWTPKIKINGHEQVAPHASLTTPNENTLFEGYGLFFAASTSGDCFENSSTSEDKEWTVEMDYLFHGEKIKETQSICVSKQTEKPYWTLHRPFIEHIKFTSKIDGKTVYYLTLLDDHSWVVGSNKLTLALYKEGHNHTFEPVKDYTINLDPRMPDITMGNHTTPNNTDPVYDSGSELYIGNVNFTMNGFWTLNFKVYDTKGELVGGSDITYTAVGGGDENIPVVNPKDYDEHAEGITSDLYFELEFE